MHNSIEELVAANTQYCSNSRAANEKGKRFEIVSKEEFTKIKIDGGLITSQQIEKCDFGFVRHSNGEFYFVELKGKDIDKAYSQIVNTIKHFETNFVKTQKRHRFGFIVGSKYPRASTANQKLKLDFASKHGKSLDIQTRELKYPPS
jgi:hypothetical protein